MLYSLDYKRAHFVRMPKSFEHYQASQAPFLYMAQFADAQQFASIELNDLNNLAAMVWFLVFKFNVMNS